MYKPPSGYGSTLATIAFITASTIIAIVCTAVLALRGMP